MGEKIKTISRGNIYGVDLEIELNEPLIQKDDLQIHIQADKFRLEMNKKEFIAYGLSILVAEKNLKNLKGLK